MIYVQKKLRLKGKSVVYIDWANVYGWEHSLKKEINPQKLFEYLTTYEEITDLRFYFGTDKNEKSQNFLKTIEKIGFTVITKPVKYIPVTEINGQKIQRRKCDFDMEACIDVHQALKENFCSFIFFTGDGDYEPLYRMLIGLRKQVIVIYTKGHLGREIWDIENGLFKAQIKNIMNI